MRRVYRLEATAGRLNRVNCTSMEAVSVDKLWSRGNTLRRRHNAHVRTTENHLEPDPARLPPIVAEKLGDLIDSFNVFVIGDPRALELDRIRLGPQDREAARRIVALAAPIARAAGEPGLTRHTSRAGGAERTGGRRD